MNFLNIKRSKLLLSLLFLSCVCLKPALADSDGIVKANWEGAFSLGETGRLETGETDVYLKTPVCWGLPEYFRARLINISETTKEGVLMIKFFDSNGDPIQTVKHDYLLGPNDGVRVKLGDVHLCDELQNFKVRHVFQEKS